MNKYIAAVFVACLTFTGCTTAQTTEVKTTLISVLQAADDSLIDLAKNPATIDQAEEALAAVAAFVPPSGPVHQALIDAQAALNLLRKNQGNVALAQRALQTVINLLQTQGKVAPGAIRHKVAPDR